MKTEHVWTMHDAAIFRGCSPSKVSKDVRRGLLSLTEDKKIDPFDPVNREWLRSRNLAPGGRPVETEGGETDSDERPGSRRAAKLEAEIANKIAATEKIELFNAQARGDLLPREMVTAFANAFGTGARTYLLALAGRITPRILASVKSGNDGAVQEMLESEVSDSLERALAMGDAAVVTLADEWPDDEPEEEQEGDSDT